MSRASASDQNPTIGLLYAEDDPFSTLRSEMLVGPMLLAGARYMRFTEQDADPRHLQVHGAIHDRGHWRSQPATQPDVILDCLPTGRQRSTPARTLLANIPHLCPPEGNRFTLLERLAGNREFSGTLVAQRPFHELADLDSALADWGAVAIKPVDAEGGLEPAIVQPSGSDWSLSAPFRSRKLDLPALHAALAPMTRGDYFLQQWIDARASDQRAMAFHLVVQQRHDGAWMAPTVQAIVASDGPFASLAAGGEHVGTPLLVAETALIQSRQRSGYALNLMLQCYAVALARTIAEACAAPPGALAFRVLLDKSLKPRLIDLDSRARAPSMPGRTIEFYRHLTDFAIGLARYPSAKPHVRQAASPASPTPPWGGQLPLVGDTVRIPIDAPGRAALEQEAPGWIDLGLGQGGRALLHQIHQKWPNQGDQAPFVSLRLGKAQNDLTPVHAPEDAIVAIEEYLGSGLLRWPETTYMRSIRSPLLARQLQQAQAVFPNRPLDLLWLEDTDLGLQGLPPQHQEEELRRTIAWFETTCAAGSARAWGIFLYYPYSRTGRMLLSLLPGLLTDCRYLAACSTFLDRLDWQLVEALQAPSGTCVLLPRGLGDDAVRELAMRKLPLLLPWKRLWPGQETSQIDQEAT